MLFGEYKNAKQQKENKNIRILYISHERNKD